MKKYILSFILIVLSSIITYILAPRPFVVHYHANFAVYINGEKWDFGASTYMEEVSRCNVSKGITPEDRIHLHDNKGGLVHIHMAASTWGDLFSNLSMGMGINYLSTGYTTLHFPDAKHQLYYVLNGKIIMNPANIPVGSTDRLLVWYGTGTQEDILSKWNTLVESDAIEYNKKDDPMSCSTNTYGILGSIKNTIDNIFGSNH